MMESLKANKKFLNTIYLLFVLYRYVCILVLHYNMLGCIKTICHY